MAPERASDPRIRALAALAAVAEGAGSQAALRAELDRAPALSGPDRGWATELTYGVLRQQRQLDAWIAGAAVRGLYGMAPDVLNVLRLGAWQLAAGLPDYAAVHATIEAAKCRLKRPQLSFAHAVLRKLATQPPSAVDPLPPWILRRIEDFAERVGQDPGALAEAFRGQAPVHLHTFDTAALTELAGLQPLPVPHCFAAADGQVFASAAFRSRRVIAQDAGSAAVAAWLGVEPGMAVADIAAGRGVKSVALAHAGGLVTAVDLSAAKLAQAVDLCAAVGTSLAATVVADASAALPLPAASFDAVLVDAPCSALGTLRRRPEVRHRRRAADLLRLADLQARILQRAAVLLRPGGVLVHATCSIAVEEGPLVVDAFLRDHSDFERDPGEAPWLAGLLDDRGDLRTHPLAHGMDGFQATRLRKKVRR